MGKGLNKVAYRTGGGIFDPMPHYEEMFLLKKVIIFTFT
jgi:hypothetical protein